LIRHDTGWGKNKQETPLTGEGRNPNLTHRIAVTENVRKLVFIRKLGKGQLLEKGLGGKIEDNRWQEK